MYHGFIPKKKMEGKRIFFPCYQMEIEIISIQSDFLSWKSIGKRDFTSFVVCVSNLTLYTSNCLIRVVAQVLLNYPSFFVYQIYRRLFHSFIKINHAKT